MICFAFYLSEMFMTSGGSSIKNVSVGRITPKMRTKEFKREQAQGKGNQHIILGVPLKYVAVGSVPGPTGVLQK